MNKQELIKIIEDQKGYFNGEGAVERELFSQIKANLKTSSITIITGIRRSGKSTLLQQLRDVAPQRDYYLNFDDDRLHTFTIEDFQLLLETFIEIFGEQDFFYFDEIQNIDGWEKFIRRLHDQGKHIFITGSNAAMLSKELGTRLTGRYVQYSLYPFSFKEYLRYKKFDYPKSLNFSTAKTGTICKHFNEYMRVGGIPEYVKYEQWNYLHSLYESIIYRDIIARYSIRSEKQLKEVALYLASNCGKEVSYNALRKLFGLGSPKTTSDYCSYLENCYFAFFMPRYNFSLKKQIQYNKKAYLIDAALAQSVGFRFSEDAGRFLENIVFLELKRRGSEVFFHKSDKECDFVVRQGNRIVEAFQVTTDISDEQTKKREIDGLCSALSCYSLKQGVILTESTETQLKAEFQGEPYQITVLPVWKWLLTS